MLNPIERPLTDGERRELSTRLQNARAESARALVKTGGASAAICGPLRLITLWLSDAPAVVIAGFWATLALVFTLWIGMPWRRLMRGQIPILEEALETNRARDLRVQSARVVEFEEEEDEGACYAFDQGGASVIFIIGQEFYEDDDFPCSDFSIAEVLSRSGNAIDTLITKRGRKLAPERLIPAQVKNQLELPQHCEVIRAPLDQLESALRRR
jgi:hypothetical protein